MLNLKEAIQAEQQLRKEGQYDVRSFAPVAKEFGFDTVKDYIEKRNAYFFQEWIPEVFYVDISKYVKVTEDAIQNNKYGIYISKGKGVHAYHGLGEIDRELCKKLGVLVVDLNYTGGTIIGSAQDFSIILVAPSYLQLEPQKILAKFTEIVGKYVPETSFDGNDILVSGKKVAGAMTRTVGTSFVWATQVTFNDYSEYIEKICTKKSSKAPSFIDPSLLTRERLEKDVLAWLVDKNQ